MADCIFCKIIEGAIPSTTVYEDEAVKVITDIAPAALGHLLVLPKVHAADFTELDEDQFAPVFGAAKKLIIAQKKALGADGVNLVQNNGAAAGQTVRHFHIHLIPRYENDGLGLAWKPLAPGMEAISEAAQKIAAEVEK